MSLSLLFLGDSCLGKGLCRNVLAQGAQVLQTASELEKRGQEQLGFGSRSPKSSSELSCGG